MAVHLGDRIAAFLDEKMPAILSTTRKDGSIQSVPVWYEHVNGSILVNGGPTRDWLRHMQVDLSAYANLGAWHERCADRPAYKAQMAAMAALMAATPKA